MPLSSIPRLLQGQKVMKSRYQARIREQSPEPAQAGNKRQPEKALEEGIAMHIFSTSATMVGVCLTVIGIFKLVFQLRPVGTIGDDLLAADAMLFLIACVLSYCALRSRRARQRRITERAADIVFLVALVGMTLI